MNKDEHKFCIVCWRPSCNPLKGSRKYFCKNHLANKKNKAYHLRIKRRVLKTINRKEGFIAYAKLSHEFEELAYSSSKIMETEVCDCSSMLGQTEQLHRISSRFYPQTFNTLRKLFSDKAKFKTQEQLSNAVLSLLDSSNAPPVTSDYDYTLTRKESTVWFHFMLRVFARHEASITVENMNWKPGSKRGKKSNIRIELKKIIEENKNTGTCIKQKDIADSLGVTEGWISVLMKDIKNKSIT
jgi:hypothetical protein